MATYKEIKGTGIQNFSSDPSNPVTGQIWYNSTTNLVKAFLVNPGSWATGGNLNSARAYAGAAGTQTSALSFGGEYAPSGPDYGAFTETYNGTNWTEVNDLNTGRKSVGGTGASNTSALAFGGQYPIKAVTESWNGTNWTEVNDLNRAAYETGTAGTQTSALSFGGDPSNTPAAVLTELWNGTNWTNVNNLNNAHRLTAGAGANNTAALAIGGSSSKTELWNGTNWTEVNNLPFSQEQGAAAGTSTAALSFGGEPFRVTTISWDGTNWSAAGDMSIGRRFPSGAGVQTAALAIGGGALPTGQGIVSTEEWNAGPETVSFTVS